MVHHVFVFGTLKEGFPNFASNRGARMPGGFATSLAYPLYLVGERHSPWMIDQPGHGHAVAGQVFQVDEAALARMDALERVGEPDGYRRMAIEVCCTDAPGEPLTAFAYLKPVAQLNAADARLGPLPEFTLEHAALYRGRNAAPCAG